MPALLWHVEPLDKCWEQIQHIFPHKNTSILNREVILFSFMNKYNFWDHARQVPSTRTPVYVYCMSEVPLYIIIILYMHEIQIY